MFGDRVGIGVTNPQDFNTAANALVVGNGVGHQGLSIFAGTSSSAGLFFADGAAGTAAYQGFIDYRHNNSDMRFGAAGGTRMVMNGNGLLIFPNGGPPFSPSAELEISSSLPAIRLTDSDGTNQFSEIERAGASLNFYARDNASNGKFVFLGDNGTSDTEFMRIETDGNVEIGDNKKFKASTYSSSYIKFEDDTKVSANSDIIFDVNGSTELMRLEEGGNVGIGVADPDEKLEVDGNIKIGSDKWYRFGGNAFQIGVDGGSVGMHFHAGSSERLTILAGGNVGIGTASPSNALDVVGHFSATSKSFLIDHPTKENKKLQYASLEGPENGVYVRGTTNSTIIELPDYWSALVHEDSITVVLTPIGKKQDLYIKSKSPENVMVGGVEGSYDYVVYGERKDIDKLEIEPLKV